MFDKLINVYIKSDIDLIIKMERTVKVVVHNEFNGEKFDICEIVRYNTQLDGYYLVLSEIHGIYKIIVGLVMWLFSPSITNPSGSVRGYYLLCDGLVNITRSRLLLFLFIIFLIKYWYGI